MILKLKFIVWDELCGNCQLFIRVIVLQMWSFFFFDRQECFMKFGFWMYDMEQIDFWYICDEKVIMYIVGDKEECVID